MAWCGGSRAAQPESPGHGVLQSDGGSLPPLVPKDKDLCKNSNPWAQP